MTDYYTPIYSPWRGDGAFGDVLRLCAPYTLLSADRLYILWTLARASERVPGDIWECGVYKGGSAMALSHGAPLKPLWLFDTFGGMPAPGEHDTHQQGDFADVDANDVARRTHAYVVQGLIPDTFAKSRSNRIAMAHIDVDLYESVMACCEVIYPRLATGGVMVIDDYGFASTMGARRAVDEYAERMGLVPLVLPTGQALIWKTPA